MIDYLHEPLDVNVCVTIQMALSASKDEERSWEGPDGMSMTQVHWYENSDNGIYLTVGHPSQALVKFLRKSVFQVLSGSSLSTCLGNNPHPPLCHVLAEIKYGSTVHVNEIIDPGSVTISMAFTLISTPVRGVTRHRFRLGTNVIVHRYQRKANPLRQIIFNIHSCLARGLWYVHPPSSLSPKAHYLFSRTWTLPGLHRQLLDQRSS